MEERLAVENVFCYIDVQIINLFAGFPLSRLFICDVELNTL